VVGAIDVLRSKYGLHRVREDAHHRTASEQRHDYLMLISARVLMLIAYDYRIPPRQSRGNHRMPL
jgi:hypothetical protein